LFASEVKEVGPMLNIFVFGNVPVYALASGNIVEFGSERVPL
jgi:hypothetical protein